MEYSRLRLDRLTQMHRALGPDTAFSRGFSVVTNEAGEIVKSKESVQKGDQLSIRFRDGDVESLVK